MSATSILRTRATPPLRRGLWRTAAALAFASAAFSAGTATAADLLFEAYVAEMRNPGEEWVVVSNHFRHTVNCGAVGCVLMGPTDDHEACDDWVRAYNEIDPFDHARCVVWSRFDDVGDIAPR